ncbi:Crp/Fnr family transcriptional regulator [Streptomyces spirodelae]|uniref:Crp/Fnr family transcriptional regulator n=1 Tax=Streptomyces spirodelae TaxID=2812904 RepID=A0ABS3WM29_9ACTN|nr:Crp/Fnr family transcriptional regulator [Streptomyces spirodelae]MBO8184175.1 Crp/Fnr family transcriptional regulator [Streptomyces spirodelae]
MTRSVSTDTSQPWLSLSRVPLLAALSDAALRQAWDDSVPLAVPTGATLRRADDPATHLLLLLRGRMAATATTSAGRVLRFGEWAAPRALDKVAVIDGAGHTATFSALTPCAVRSLPRDCFLTLVEDVPSVRSHVLRVLAGHARRQQQRLMATATLSAEARLSSWLLEEAATVPGHRVTLPGTQQTLADLLGVTRVTVNRALARLRRDRLIEVRGRTITLLAPELLELRAQG